VDALATLVNLAILALFIVVLVKLCRQEGVGKGILGLICALYSFVWGWQNHKKLGLTSVMTAWSILVVIGMILNVVVRMQSAM